MVKTDRSDSSVVDQATHNHTVGDQSVQQFEVSWSFGYGYAIG